MDIHPPAPEWTFRHVVGATLILALVAIVFWLLYLFNEVVFILFVAIVIGTVIRPVVIWLYNRGVPCIAGIILVQEAVPAEPSQ
jgi:predicted PurR-regulated permease PerM